MASKATNVANKAKNVGMKAVNKAKDAGMKAVNKAKDAGMKAVDKAKSAAKDAVNKAKEVGLGALGKKPLAVVISYYFVAAMLLGHFIFHQLGATIRNRVARLHE